MRNIEAPPREFVRAVRDYCAAHDLLARGDGVVAAVSGGPDSVALLLALREMAGALRLRIRVAHLDHGLRRGSGREAAFVRKLALRLGLPVTTGKARVAAEARRARISLEEAGRAARYRFLLGVARRARAEVVAVGHTRDDQAETVLMRLLRGSSRAGLRGIPPRRRLATPGPQGRTAVYVVRPLLGRSRAEIEAYLRRWRQRALRDPSNASDAFMRNRLRNSLIPALARGYNPRIREALARAAQALEEDDELLESLASAAFLRTARRRGREVVADAGRLRRLPLPLRRRVLLLAAASAGADVKRLAQAHLDALVRLAGSRRRGEVHLPGTVAAQAGGKLSFVRAHGARRGNVS